MQYTKQNVHQTKYERNYNSSFNGTNPFGNILKLGILLTDTNFEANWIANKLSSYNQINIIHSSFSFMQISDSQTCIIIVWTQ